MQYIPNTKTTTMNINSSTSSAVCAVAQTDRTTLVTYVGRKSFTGVQYFQSRIAGFYGSTQCSEQGKSLHWMLACARGLTYRANAPHAPWASTRKGMQLGRRRVTAPLGRSKVDPRRRRQIVTGICVAGDALGYVGAGGGHPADIRAHRRGHAICLGRVCPLVVAVPRRRHAHSQHQE